MANRRRRYCVYFSRHVDVFNTFYFVFKIFYFLSKIFYFVSKVFISVYFYRRYVDAFTTFSFVCKIFNIRLEKAKETYVILEIVWKIRLPMKYLAFRTDSIFARHVEDGGRGGTRR